MYPIEGVLDHYRVEYDPDKDGNQKVYCPFHEDSIASASVNLGEGVFNCYGCPIKGDAIRVIELVEGKEFVEAKRLAEELARGVDRQISRGSGRANTFLPSRSRNQRGHGRWVPSWARKGT